MDRINVLTEKTPERSLMPSTERAQQDGAVMN